ncbi:hypothetical protein B0H14DRAFT_2601133 [Mycena olivaceomarginata]|nr:hypothetical protein B0H14DRAFT_2601133 [Mycena olivaceomarginata]
MDSFLKKQQCGWTYATSKDARGQGSRMLDAVQELSENNIEKPQPVFTAFRAKICRTMHGLDQVALPVIFRPSGHRKCCEWAVPASTSTVVNVIVWCPMREIPVQITVDGGTEPQYMYQFHEQLRAQFLPDIASTEAPACVTLKSSDNIPIEALWSYFLQYTGHDLKAAILLGKTEDYINVENELHIDLFRWSNKYLPSGVAPEQVFQHPENFGLRHAGIPVDLNVVRRLRNTLPKSREDGFRSVPLDLDLCVVATYESLGSPELTIPVGWTI